MSALITGVNTRDTSMSRQQGDEEEEREEEDNEQAKLIN